ncbi:MAG: sensor histidine kinase [Vibrionaceae bacterium]|nr:sensor histidine kinase [Vibrionaceae bacterium]
MSFIFHSNTTEKFDFNVLAEKMIASQILSKANFKVIAHISELISNIFEHSQSEIKEVIHWKLTIKKCGNELMITVCDDGCGIEHSLLNKQLNVSREDIEPIRFAVEGRAGNRGLGLRSIYDAAKSGSIESFKLVSDESAYFVTSQMSQVENLSQHHKGVSATIALSQKESL